MNRKIILCLIATVAVLSAVIGFGWFVLAGNVLDPSRTDRRLTPQEQLSVQKAIGLMRRQGLTDDAAMAGRLLSTGIWRSASSEDIYIKGAEAQGDMPFAYTLSNGKHPKCIVLASRFFTDATDTGRAALMIHEMGHYRAYLATGDSTEFDGYKREYDQAKQLGLSANDGMVYFGMLDGVSVYVVPKAPGYAEKPDIKQYMNTPPNQ